MSTSNVGKLYVVATPIGNLGDVTLRAIDTLKQVDLIAAEDTRHSSQLLQHYGIKTRLISLHEYNEIKRAEFICDELEKGKNIALISDAGTPLISDPGYHLIKKVLEKGLKVIPVPGACAFIAALSVAGLPTDKFIFEGFLPAKSNQQLQRLQNLSTEERTIIFYESPHRLLQTIGNMIVAFGESRHVVLAKELTKTFETIFSAPLITTQKWLLDNAERQKGEFVILVKGAENIVPIDEEVLRVLKILAADLPAKQASMLCSKITGVGKNILYKMLHVKE